MGPFRGFGIALLTILHVPFPLPPLKGRMARPCPVLTDVCATTAPVTFCTTSTASGSLLRLRTQPVGLFPWSTIRFLDVVLDELVVVVSRFSRAEIRRLLA